MLIFNQILAYLTHLITFSYNPAFDQSTSEDENKENRSAYIVENQDIFNQRQHLANNIELGITDLQGGHGMSYFLSFYSYLY